MHTRPVRRVAVVGLCDECLQTCFQINLCRMIERHNIFHRMRPNWKVKFVEKSVHCLISASHQIETKTPTTRLQKISEFDAITNFNRRKFHWFFSKSFGNLSLFRDNLNANTKANTFVQCSWAQWVEITAYLLKNIFSNFLKKFLLKYFRENLRKLSTIHENLKIKKIERLVEIKLLALFFDCLHGLKFY